MSKQRRRKHSPEEKVRLIRLHLVEGVAISDLCEEHGIHPTMYHRWQVQFFENGAAAFAPKKSASSPLEKKVGTLEEKLVVKNEVLSELMEEHVQLKKKLGET